MYYERQKGGHLKAIITREQAVQILGGERELNHRMLGLSDELARLNTGAKLFSKGRLGSNPIFEIRSGTCDSDGDDIKEIIEALEQGKTGLFRGSRVGC